MLLLDYLTLQGEKKTFINLQEHVLLVVLSVINMILSFMLIQNLKTMHAFVVIFHQNIIFLFISFDKMYIGNTLKIILIL